MSLGIPHFLLLGLCSLLVRASSSASAPLLLWSQHIPAPETRFTTLVDQVDPEDVLEEYRAKVPNAPIVAFVQDHLDVEQLTHSQLPLVSKLFDESSQFNTLLFTDAKYSPEFYSLFKKFSIQNDMQRSKNIVYLKGKNFKENEKTIQEYMKLVNESQPVIYMFTGKDNQFMKVNERTRRAAEEKDDSTKKILGNTCSYFFASSVQFNGETLDISSVTETCENETSGNIKYAKEITLISTSKHITFKFKTKQLLPWTIESIEITPEQNNKEGNTSLLISTPALSTENGFSYSCGNAVFEFKNDNKVEQLVFERFQIQPFIDTKSSTKFSESFDCTVWFTLPIFSGLIVSLILVIILYFGVRALMSISTPDRFENPKGRTLIITNFEE